MQTNDLFKGGLLLMGGGAILALVRAWPGRLWELIKRQSMIVIDIPDRDLAFNWVNLWLSNHEYSKSRARLLTVKSERGEGAHDKPKIIFSPAPGTHWLWYHGRLMILSRERQQMGDDSQSSTRDPFREYFTIRILGRRRDIALQLIDEAYKFAHPQTIDKISVHRITNYGDWNLGAWAPKRPLSSIVLPSDLANTLVTDLKTFLSDEAYYVKLGIPYRRGYLFYGPPGNGKTSAVIGLATELGMDIGILNLKSSQLSDEDLSTELANAPPNTIILLEDIDCVVSKRDTNGRVTFSGLLNALDGLGSAHGQIVFMTTNHRDRLDEALIRPGRCDVQQEFPNAAASQKIQMFHRFFPDSDLGVKFLTQVPGSVSMATLQQHMMKYRDNPQEAVEQAVHIKEGRDE